LRQPCFVECVLHEDHPSVPGALVDGKRYVPHPQPRMAALLDIAGWTAEPANEKIAQSNLCAVQISRRIHRTENVVARHLGIERADQPGEPFFANTRIDLLVSQIHNPSMSDESHTGDESPKSAYQIAMERLRRSDAEAGVEEREVSQEQKAEIAEVKRVYSAKAAEAEILYKSKLMSVFEPEERAKIEQGHRRDIERIKSDEARKLTKLRGQSPRG